MYHNYLIKYKVLVDGKRREMQDTVFAANVDEAVKTIERRDNITWSDITAVYVESDDRWCEVEIY